MKRTISEIGLDQIKVKYGRIREDLGDIEELANSILRFGQLQPIILDNDNNIIDGFRRWTALKSLGADVATIIYMADVDELMSRELELEANIVRKDMTWQERVKGIAELDRIKRDRDPSWGQIQTAQVIGSVRQADVSDAVKLAKLMEVMPELKDAKNMSQAMNMARTRATLAIRHQEVKDAPELYSDIESHLVLGDSVEVIRDIPDHSFHAIITDPPFGVDYDERVEGTSGVATAYADDRQGYLRLLTIARDCFRVLRPDGWLVWFCGISWYEVVKRTFREAGFTVDEIPIIWDRSDGRTFTNRPDRYFTRGYDIAIHGFRGNPRMVIPGRSNVLRIPPVESRDRTLLVERPVELYAEIINRLTIPGESVADFFTGSGSCLAAAASTGRRYFGVEIDPGRRASAIQKIRAYTPE